MQDGGFGWGVGIYGQKEATLTLFSEYRVHEQRSWRLFGRDDECFARERRWWRHFPQLVLEFHREKQSGLCERWSRHRAGGERYGHSTFAYGARLENSPGCEVSNNTLYRNWGKQLFLWPDHFAAASFSTSGSSNSVAKNNICEAYHSSAFGIYVSRSSQSGLASDYNDFYSSFLGGQGGWREQLNIILFHFSRLEDGDDRGHKFTRSQPRLLQCDCDQFPPGIQLSLLIDAGQNLASVQEDGDNEPRPSGNAQDIGYDEFVDSDDDGLADMIEKAVTHTNPDERDSDHDGLPDGWEVTNALDPNNGTGNNGTGG